jgi:hypothetical protein
VKLVFSYIKFTYRSWKIFLLVSLTTYMLFAILSVVASIISLSLFNLNILNIAMANWKVIASIFVAFIGLPLFVNACVREFGALPQDAITSKDIRTLCLLVDRRLEELKAQYQEKFGKHPASEDYYPKQCSSFFEKSFDSPIKEKPPLVQEMQITSTLLWSVQDLRRLNEEALFVGSDIKEDEIERLCILVEQHLSQIEKEYKVQLNNLPHRPGSLSLSFETLFSNEVDELVSLYSMLKEELKKRRGE